MTLSYKDKIFRISYGSFFIISTGIFILFLPLIFSLKQPALMHGSDFTTAFYVAGRMVADGQAADLYPDAQAQSLLFTPFNTYAHHILKDLANNKTAIYMYSPLTAFLFSWVGKMSPNVALIVWQLVSILAWLLSSKLMAQAMSLKWPKCFWQSILFLPIFQTILIGQLGIVLGLLPMSFGYWFLVRGRPFIAGLIWSLIILKPQFLPVVFLLVFALAYAGKWQTLCTYMLGTLLLVLIMLIYPDASLFYRWILTLRLADAIFVDPSYGYPHYLVSSLPAAILQVVPLPFRNSAKACLYTVACAITVHLFIRICKLFKQSGKDYLKVLPVAFALSVSLLTLIIPHLLFYDLSILAFAGMAIYGCIGDRKLITNTLLVWLFIDCYLLLFMFVNSKLAQPLLLVAVLSWFYMGMLKAAEKFSSADTVDTAI